MKKALKIIGIILGIIVLIIGILGFVGWRKMQKFNLAQEKANYIMENLDNPKIADNFQLNTFQKKSLNLFLAELDRIAIGKIKTENLWIFLPQKILAEQTKPHLFMSII